MAKGKKKQLKPRGNKMETTLKERQRNTILCDLYLKGLLVFKDYPITILRIIAVNRTDIKN